MSKFSRCLILGLGMTIALAFPPGRHGAASGAQKGSIPNVYDLIEAVNALRSSHGLPAYSAHPILMQTAQGQANYMAATGQVTHYGADGSRPFQRALAAGYPVAGDLSLGGFFSENIQAGTNLTPSEAVQAWTGDAPHLNTMLSPNLSDIGAGIAQDGSFYYYVIDCAQASGSSVSYTPSGAGTFVPAGTAPGAEATIAVAIVSTPNEVGAVVHVVEAGQTLWQIALAYQVKVDEIRRLNNLGSENTIYIGQKLLIQQAVTPTILPPTPTRTLDPSTSTPLPPFEIFTQTPTGTITPMAAAPASDSAGGLAVISILVVALVGAAIVSWAGRQRPL
jgi:LysM repeat protein